VSLDNTDPRPPAHLSVNDPAQPSVAVVMAAGLGTRMRSRLPKLLHPLCGRPMLAYTLDAAAAATGTRPLVVYSPATAAIRDVFAEAADFALQDEPRGTGDAVRAALVALPSARPDAVDLLVLNGDVPRLQAELLAALLEQRRATGAPVALITVAAAEPAALGRVVRSEAGSIERIVEAKDASEDELEIGEINSGLYAFDLAWLRRRLPDVQPSPATGELYLTDLVRLAREDGLEVTSVVVEDDGRLLGINDRLQLAEAEGELRAELITRFLLDGVTMEDPSTAYIDATVELASDVTLEPNVVLRGRTRVGEGTTIGSWSRIVDTTIGRDCRIVASVLESSAVEDGVTIGPFAHLRAGSVVASGAEIGNYAEIKNSRLGAGVKQHHMSYLGDAEIGAGTNVGAGTITANWDGRRKHRTRIGERVFLGVDTMLVAPIDVGDGAKTGAGAVVTHDVPPGALVVGVPARVREPHEASEPPAPEGTPSPDESSG
jgi:bifunctional UDP-N-acetylglucosamine pyrophosphorylase/glucosamine-1-phosphate N-acetyltransferase